MKLLPINIIEGDRTVPACVNLDAIDIIVPGEHGHMTIHLRGGFYSQMEAGELDTILAANELIFKCIKKEEPK